MNKEYRKGAVDLTDLAIGIVVLGIVVTIGATILVNVRDSQVTNLGTTGVSNEAVTVAGLKAGTAQLSTQWVTTINTCNNNTQDGLPINSGNWTSVTNADTHYTTMANSSSQWIDKPWSCNYTVRDVTDPRYSLADDAATGMGEYGNWFKIIVIVGVAAVILALIFMAFGGRNSSSGGGIGGSY